MAACPTGSDINTRSPGLTPHARTVQPQFGINSAATAG
jgi:hypothetical protein